jgi:hypothetical protein
MNPTMSKRRNGPHVPHRLVIVEWEDSAQPVSDWQWVETYQLPQIVRCVSVGYLIAETEQAIAIAPNIGDLGHERIQASGIIRIPRSAVSRIANLG